MSMTGIFAWLFSFVGFLSWVGSMADIVAQSAKYIAHRITVLSLVFRAMLYGF